MTINFSEQEILEKVKLILSEQNLIQKVINRGKDFFDDTPCSTDYTSDARDWKDLYNMLIKRKKIKLGSPILLLWGPTQTMYYTKDGKNVIREMPVSTGSWGFGNTGSNPSTSTGLMKITNKRKGEKKYQVFVSKTPTNLVLGPNIDSTRKDKNGKTHTAEVLTGILELEGLEPCNQNVARRNIYIHGTNREKSLGNKASNGCIRVSNDNILYLLNELPIGTKLYVRP